MLRPQTIQIFLPDGDPRGTRVAEITTRIVRVIEVPRSQLADFLKMPEAQQVGVYFLMGELSEAGLPRAYIGQSGNVGTRLVQHNQGQGFWNRALQPGERQHRRTTSHARAEIVASIQGTSTAGLSGRPPTASRWTR